MSPVGHSIVGATIAVTLWRSNQTSAERGKILCAMIVAANIPDLPFPFWGHTRYDISHSVFSGLVIVVCYILVARFTILRQTFAGNWPFLIAGTMAMYSHYFLDTLYKHGKGLAAFQPFSDARVALPLPWLAHMQLDPLWSTHNFQVWVIELLTFGVLSSLCLGAIFLWKEKVQSTLKQ